MITKNENRILPYIWKRLFSAPYLPRVLVGIGLIIIITDAFIYLISQPTGYWKNYEIAHSEPAWLYQLTSSNPLYFAGAVLTYIIIIGLVLDGLSRIPALFLWFAITFIHLNNLFSWNVYNLSMRLPINETTRYYLITLFAIIVVALLGLFVAHWLFPQESLPDARPARWVRKISMSPKGIAITTAIWLIVLVSGLIASTFTPVYGWQLVPLEVSPSAKFGPVVTYDSKRERIILFGGANGWDEHNWIFINETWEWDGTNWKQLFPENSPPSRSAHTMAYDVKRDVIVLFGGGDENGVFNDTWEWDGQDWHQRFPDNAPPARNSHEMFYDPRRERIILYGGYDHISTFFNDAWEWDGQEWRQIDFETASPVASGFAIAFNPSTNETIAFLSGYPGGTWAWHENRWSLIHPTNGEPPDRYNTDLAYDAENELMVLFGGTGNEQDLNDTWVIKGREWHKLDLHLTPSPRRAHVTFYDPSRKRVIIFGGIDDTSTFGGMYELILPEDIK